MRHLLFLALIAANSASAQAQSDRYADVKSSRPAVSIHPSDQDVHTVSAGEAMIKQENVRIASGAVLLAETTPPVQTRLNFSLPSGTSLYEISTSKNFKACTLRLGSDLWPACLIDDDGDGTFDRMSSNSAQKAYPLASPVKYEKSEISMPPSYTGLAKSLLYQGASERTVKLSYREFSNDLARPAFNEELSLPLSEEFPQKIAAKGIIFVVEKIDGLGITYRIDDDKAWR